MAFPISIPSTSIIAKKRTAPIVMGAVFHLRKRECYIQKIKRAHHTVCSFYWRRRRDLLFCGKATAVAIVHRTVAKSRLSNPSYGYLNNKISTPYGVLILLAEKEGFEPSIPFWGIHDFQSCALGQLRDFSIELHCNQPVYITTFSKFCQALFFDILR